MNNMSSVDQNTARKAGKNNRGRGRLLDVGGCAGKSAGHQLTVNQALRVIVTSPHVGFGVCRSRGGEGPSPLTTNPGSAGRLLGSLLFRGRTCVGSLAGQRRVVPRPVGAGVGTFRYFALLLISTRQPARRRKSVHFGASQQRRSAISCAPQRTAEHCCYCIKSHFQRCNVVHKTAAFANWQMKTCSDVLTITTPVRSKWAGRCRLCY